MKGFFILIAAAVAAWIANFSLGTGAGFAGFGRPTAWIITTIIFVGLLAYVGNALKQRYDGIFIDDRNRISLARFQLALWTVLLVPALLSAGLSNAAAGFATPLMISVPGEVWALLGIGAFSFVTAPVIIESRKKDEKPKPALVARVETTVKTEDTLPDAALINLQTNVPAKADAPDARWMDLIRGDTTAGFAYIDISKVQQLAFTILLITVYAAAVYGKLAGSTPVSEFPPVDQGFIALLGLSHAAYLTYKKTSA